MVFMKALIGLAFAFVVAIGIVAGCASATSSSTDAGDCANHNDSRCPAAYSTSLGSQPCPYVGLHCQYIGSGLGSSPPGCPGAASLWCEAPGGPDAGSDGAPGVWKFAQ